MGLLSNIPSAAGGWEIPSSVGSAGVLMVGHGGEKMLPADLAMSMLNDQRQPKLGSPLATKRRNKRSSSIFQCGSHSIGSIG